MKRKQETLLTGQRDIGVLPVWISMDLSGRLVYLGFAYPTRFEKTSCIVMDNERLTDIFQQVEEYLQGKRTFFTAALHLRGTEFEKKVWTALFDVKYGETASYGDIARSIGHPGSSRAVGNAIGKNPVSIIVPCHRIVPTRVKRSTEGTFIQAGNYAYGSDIKLHLLNLERTGAR